MSSTFYIAVLLSISSILQIIHYIRLKKKSPEEINGMQKFVFYASIVLCMVGFVMIIRELLVL